jgi:hypothetical protein
MRQILVVCPQRRDPPPGRWGGFHVRHGGPDLDSVDVDPEALLDVLASSPADGVIGTKDRSALMAALIAERLGTPGPSPNAVVACQHKPSSRDIQRRISPASTPASELLSGLPSFPPPWFVKPVVGRLSQEARRVDDPETLLALADDLPYREGYARLARLAGVNPESTRGFLVEQLVTGAEVTLEGYVRHGVVTTIGVTDSVKYPGTNSFERFEYPSALAAVRLSELDNLARRLVAAHGLDDAFFNVEFLVSRSGLAQIVELNPRIASQFAPLVQAVHGRSSYDALCSLSCGENPAWKPDDAFGVAVSYVMRVFEDALVEAVPEPEEGLEVLVSPGGLLSEQGLNDSASYRLAIFSEWAETREEAVSRCRRRAAALAFRLSSVA